MHKPENSTIFQSMVRKNYYLCRRRRLFCVLEPLRVTESVYRRCRFKRESCSIESEKRKRWKKERRRRRRRRLHLARIPVFALNNWDIIISLNETLR